jgi:hypothetical protein
MAAPSRSLARPFPRFLIEPSLPKSLSRKNTLGGSAENLSLSPILIGAGRFRQRTGVPAATDFTQLGLRI